MGQIYSSRRCSTSLSGPSVTIKKKKKTAKPRPSQIKMRQVHPLCSLADDNAIVSTSLIGETVQVCWDSARTSWFDCTVMREDAAEAKLFVRYMDGIEEWVHRDEVRLVKDRKFDTPQPSSSSPSLASAAS